MTHYSNTLLRVVVVFSRVRPSTGRSKGVLVAILRERVCVTHLSIREAEEGVNEGAGGGEGEAPQDVVSFSILWRGGVFAFVSLGFLVVSNA